LGDAKNLLRPFFNAKKKLPRWKQFQAIRSSLSISDLQTLLAQIEGNPAYRFPGLGNTFPVDSTSVPDAGLARLSLSLKMILKN